MSGEPPQYKISNGVDRTAVANPPIGSSRETRNMSALKQRGGKRKWGAAQ